MLNKYIQKYFNNLAQWAYSWGVKLSKTKIVGIIFNNNKTITHKFYLKLNDNPLNQVNKVTFLGFVLDQNLHFKSHIDNLTETWKTFINILRLLGGGGGGAPNVAQTGKHY